MCRGCAINRLLQELSIKCAKEGGVRDYFQVGVIGYGMQVAPAFSGMLAGRELVPIGEVARCPARVEERVRREDDGAGGLLERTVKFPIWFEPKFEGGTPMTAALTQAKSVVKSWLQRHPGCFPPIVINITDGESTDGDPSRVAEEIKLQASADGPVLLLNAHLSSDDGRPVSFPDNEADLPNDHARLLFRMSSYLPRYMQEILAQDDRLTSDGMRGFVYNADIVEVISFLDIGTRTSDLR
ncbi:MAG: vWA domain-containing protein [Solirubrobacteraceae bacterium]